MEMWTTRMDELTSALICGDHERAASAAASLTWMNDTVTREAFDPRYLRRTLEALIGYAREQRDRSDVIAFDESVKAARPRSILRWRAALGLVDAGVRFAAENSVHGRFEIKRDEAGRGTRNGWRVRWASGGGYATPGLWSAPFRRLRDAKAHAEGMLESLHASGASLVRMGGFK